MKIYPILYIAASWSALLLFPDAEFLPWYSIGVTIGVVSMWISE